MEKKSAWIAGAVCGAALAFGLTLGGAATGADQGQPVSMAKKIKSAKSRADQEALAAQYEQEAKDLQKKAEEHKEMAKAYSETGFLEVKHDLVTHCEKLAREYADAAKEDLALAKLHRRLAEKAK